MNSVTKVAVQVRVFKWMLFRRIFLTQFRITFAKCFNDSFGGKYKILRSETSFPGSQKV